MTTIVEMTSASGGDDKIAGISKGAFYTVLGFGLVACLVLGPLSVFGLRKWCAYRELLQQYDQLRQNAGGNDFPEMDMTGNVGNVEIIPSDTYDNPHTGIIPTHQERATPDV